MQSHSSGHLQHVAASSFIDHGLQSEVLICCIIAVDGCVPRFFLLSFAETLCHSSKYLLSFFIYVLDMLQPNLAGLILDSMRLKSVILCQLSVFCV